MEAADFRVRVLDAAPPEMSVGALRQAMQDFAARGEYTLSAVGACIMRAGELDERNAERATSSRPVRMRGAHVATFRLLKWLPRWARQQRRALFGDDGPPFDTHRLAAHWVEHDMAAGTRTERATEAQKQWREVKEALQRFHRCSLGWAHLEADSRAIEFDGGERYIRREVFPNGDPRVIAFQRSIWEVYRRTGIAQGLLTKFVLTDQLPNSAFQRVACRLTVFPPADGVPDVSTVGEISVYVPNLRREDLRQAFSELNGMWNSLPTTAGFGNRRAGVSEKLAKLVAKVAQAGGPPSIGQAPFWKQIAAQTGYPTWKAAKQAHWRVTKKN